MTYRLCIFISVIFYQVSFANNITIPKGYEDKLSAVILNLDNNEIEYSYNPDTPRLIASNMKLVTTQVVLSNLPTNYQYTTVLKYTGNITNSTLDGDLYIVGSGDPTLTRNDLVNLFKQAKLKKITGHVYIDNTIFNSYPKYSMLKPEKYDPDTVLPDGLMVDEHLSRFTLHTGKSISISSNLYGFKINNKLKINPRLNYCSQSINDDTDFDLSGNTITISGEIAKNCNNYQLVYNFLDKEEYNIMAVNYALDKANIECPNKIKYAKSPNDSIKLSSIKSALLPKIIKNMNKYSNNLYAETLLLTLSSNLTNNENSYQNAKYIYESYIKTNAIYNDDFELENGAGLSRVEKLSAMNMINMLNIAYHSDTFNVFFDSLPIAGQSGTLANRFKNLGTKVHFKTGTLNDTSSYSGYFYTKQNQYAVVFIANDIDTTKSHDNKIFNSWVNKLLEGLN